MDYDKEQIRQIQKKALEILLYFKKICDQHDIRFYVGSGCYRSILTPRGLRKTS